MNIQTLFSRTLHKAMLMAAVAVLLATDGISALAAAPPTVNISSIPLTLVAPAHPQVMVAIGNSESMDGQLSGAILAGSGTTVTQLQSSSSPVNFSIPTGFTPPLNAGSSGSAPYTVTCGSNSCDNSPSRMNVAKISVNAILNAYADSTDFGLMDYSTSSTSIFTTWLYVMSPSGGFTFSTTNTSPPAGDEYVLNPCYNQTGSNTVVTDCGNMVAKLGATLLTSQYMLVSNSSDDPSVNDVLYAGSGGVAPVCLVYGGPSPATPYPPNFALSDYNVGNILETYSNSVNSCARQTGPTNAGFVPFTTQTMYMERGFGYGGSQSAATGNVAVNITSAGTSPTPAQVTTYVNKFSSFLAPETNSTSTGEIKASAGQSPMAGLMTKALSYFNTNPASSNGCTALRYVVFITDGLPTEDLKGNFWPPVGSASAAGYGMTAAFNSDGSLDTSSNTNDQALLDAVSSIKALKTAGIKVFIIGVGAGVDPVADPAAASTLTAMAVAGGTINYYPATSPGAVVVQMQSILNAIQGENLSVSSAAVNSTGLKQGAVAYQAQYTSSDSPWADWTGNLLAFPINATNAQVNTTTPNWTAKPLLDTEVASGGWSSTRFIATWNPTLNSGAGGGAGFEWANLSTTQQTALQPSDTLGSLRVNYLRGDQSHEQQNQGNASTAFRNRSHILGDIVNSNPLFIGNPQGPYLNTASYLTFETTYKTRKQMLYVGANDGMLHAFDANTGAEKWAYVPNGVFTNLVNLTKPTYNQSHQFFVDGSPIASDVQFSDASWHTVMLGGLNAGGNSMYAIDVTNPVGITSEANVASNVLWEYTDSTLGLTFGQPAINLTNSASSPFMAFFGSGYNNSDGNVYLYALNVQTGALIAKLNLCTLSAVTGACSSTVANGLSGVVVVNSSGNFGAAADTVYAGDLQGNLWKINISNATPGACTSTATCNWTVTVLFQARDSSGNRQPITTTPTVSLHPLFPKDLGVVVYFGTGQFLGTPDVTTTGTQSFYAIWDAAGLVAGTSTASAAALPLIRANLTQQAITDTTTTVCVLTGAGGSPPPCTNQTFAVRTVTNCPITWGPGTTQCQVQAAPAAKTTEGGYGWYVDLPDSGERAVTNSRLEGGTIIFTTYVPAPNTCTVGGKAWLMSLNFASGGSFTKPEIDLNGDTKLDSSDQVNGQNPVGLGLGSVYATSPTILSASLGDVNQVKLITKSTGQIQSVMEHGPGLHRDSWWQIY